MGYLPTVDTASPNKAGSVRTTLLVAGMRTPMCREQLAAALEGVPGVREVQINLYRAHAVIEHAPSCDRASLVRAVEKAGYGATIARTS
jgi:copper chaperone CopZ